MKRISFYEINKIKRLQVEIFEIEDDDCPDGRRTAPKYRAIEKILSKYGPEERKELRENIKWELDECYLTLESLGWTITTKSGNVIYGLHPVD